MRAFVFSSATVSCIILLISWGWSSLHFKKTIPPSPSCPIGYLSLGRRWTQHQQPRSCNSVFWVSLYVFFPNSQGSICGSVCRRNWLRRRFRGLQSGLMVTPSKLILHFNIHQFLKWYGYFLFVSGLQMKWRPSLIAWMATTTSWIQSKLSIWPWIPQCDSTGI